jgi:hypothetical protein
MPGHIDPKVIGKYLKVRTLWERTSGNEKEAAARILSQLQNTYPGIEQQCQHARHNGNGHGTGPLPSWREAMRDALELLAGAAAPNDLLEKYLAYIDALEQPVEPEPVAQTVRRRPRLRDFVSTTIKQGAAGVALAIDINSKGAAFFERAMSDGASDAEIDEVADEIGRVARQMFITWVGSLR